MSDSQSNNPRGATLANWRTAPYNTWSFRHVRDLLPSAAIRRGTNFRALPRSTRALHNFRFEDRDGGTHTLEQHLAQTHTDALVILHRGAVVHERYWNGMRGDEQHILMSVSKSMTALLAGVLIGEGKLDPDGLVTDYIPAAKGGGFEGATVRHLLDMRTGIEFDEDYLATGGAIIQYREAMGWNPPLNPGDKSDLRSFLPTLPASRAHGGHFQYVSPNSDMLTWITEEVGGRSYAELFSEKIWRPMGAEFDAYVTVDRLGGARGAGGICMSARDMARVGQMMLEGGISDGTSVIPSEWVTDTATGGDREAWANGNFAYFFPGGAYRNKWYQYGNDLGAYCGLGIHGQFVYVAPGADVVIARFGSHPQPLDDRSECLWVDAMDAIARALA